MSLSNLVGKLRASAFDVKTAAIGYSNADKCYALMDSNEQVFDKYVESITSTAEATKGIKFLTRFIELNQNQIQGIVKIAETERMATDEMSLAFLDSALALEEKFGTGNEKNIRGDTQEKASKILSETNTREAIILEKINANNAMALSRIKIISDRFGIEAPQLEEGFRFDAL